MSFILGMLANSGGRGGGWGDGGGWWRWRRRLFGRRRIVGRRRRFGKLVMDVILTIEEQRRVDAAIKRAETRTDGEIVCVVARASSDYLTYAVAWSALIALAAPWLLLAATQLTVQQILLVQVVRFRGALSRLLHAPALAVGWCRAACAAPRRIARRWSSS